MTELSNSKTDKLACSIHAFADGVALLDDKFGDENGNVKITNLDDGIQLASLGLDIVKEIYKCQGKEFVIKIPGISGVGGEIVNLIIKLILKLQDGKEDKIVSTTTVSNDDSISTSA